MAVPAWFNATAYFNNKLAASGYANDLELRAAFLAAGYDNSPEGLYRHFEDYGNSEGVSPNEYFVADEYLYYKAVQYYSQETGQNLSVRDITVQQVQSMRLAMQMSGMSPWEHYLQYGAWEVEAPSTKHINPSTTFDTEKYLEAKLAHVKAADPSTGWTMSGLIEALKVNGYTPLTHYLEHGRYEISPTTNLTVDSGAPGKTFLLDYADDTLYGTGGDDYFFAKLGALNDGDYIDGSFGYDTLEAYIGGNTNGGAIDALTTQPWITNVEKIIFRAQAVKADLGTNLTPMAHIDAGNISGMSYLQNDNSRAAMVVEDVRSYSNQMTIAWSNADPGADSALLDLNGLLNVGVNYGVYFDPQHLRPEAQSSSGTMRVELMDIKSANDTASANPLKTNPYNVLKFQFTPNGGTAQNVILTLQNYNDNTDGGTFTYDDLVAAINNAINVAGYAGVITAEKGDAFTATSQSTTDPNEQWSGTGNLVLLKSNSGFFENASWSATGDIPGDSAYRTIIRPLESTTCPLIVTDIHLDNVGRVEWADPTDPNCLPANSIYGSESGDMIVGSMSNRGGVERFNVKVDRGSWLASLSSTNEALRYVKVEKDDSINGVLGDGDAHLFIGRQLDDNPHFGYLVGKGTSVVPGNEGPDSSYYGRINENIMQWTDRAFLLSTDGLEDVKVFDATGFEGNLNIGARLTASSFEKYLRDVDGPNSINDGFAPNGEFVYNLGTKGDILNMSVAGGVAADNDFKLSINAGAGDDFVNFFFTGDQAGAPTANQVRTSNALRNVVINGDAGKDTVKVWGNTAVTVNGGADADTIFVSQLADGQNIGAPEQNAVFIFNAGAPDDRGILNTGIGAQSLYNDILSTVPTISYAGLGTNEKVQVVVTFKGFTATFDIAKLIPNTAAGATGSGTISTLEVNAAIIKAINNHAVLSKVLVAKDGAGYSLLIESLIDGNIGLDELDISFRGSNATTTTGSNVSVDDTGIAADGAYYGGLYSTHYATNGAADNLLETRSDAVGLDMATASYIFSDTDINGYAGLTFGDYLAVRIDAVRTDPTNNPDGVVYYAQNALVDTNGNGVMLTGPNGIYTVTENPGPAGTDGFTITPIDLTDYVNGVSGNTHSARLYEMRPVDYNDDYLNVDGTNTGTDSLNRVWGGEGDDVIVLNVNSTPEWYDVLEYHNKTVGSEGHDKIFNFQIGSDKIDLSEYGTLAHVVLGIPPDANNAWTAAVILEALRADGTYDAALSKGGALIQHNATNTYSLVAVNNAATDGLAQSEITIVGTITFDSSTGAIADTDLIGA